ncbi:BTAD domain-containing putative transcriptional regulator [Micromonospora sp. NPDC018662]|uniref:AfsR/SARP family transcriptional regulator n=1 Tax=Micromonospora sp. NPDC018662 TaxID=3364238 RepID=UPI0037AE37D4
MQFRILGPIEIDDERRGEPIFPTGSKQRSLLGALVVKAGQVLAPHRLIDELWGEQPPANAANALQAHIARLRRLLPNAGDPGQPRIVTHSLGYLLEPDPAGTDADRFLRLSAQGRALVPSDPHRAVELLRQALALWRGPALEGCAGGDICLVEAAQLEESRLTALETTFDASLRAGLHDAITGELEELTVEYPFRERFYDLLMVAFYRCGRQAEALGVYERARARLSYELGVNPGPALVNRVREVLSHAPELDSPPPAPIVGTPPVLATRAVGGHDRHARHRGGVDLGDELVELHHRLDRLGREQEILSRRLEQLTALAAAGSPAVLRPAV